MKNNLFKQKLPAFLTLLLGLTLVAGCGSNPSNDSSNSQPQASYSGLEVKFLVGSALKHFCQEAATQFNQQKPQLENGQAYYLSCEAAGSGDVVNKVVTLGQQLKTGTIQPEDEKFPTLISVDGEIYHSQLIYQMEQIFPGQNYIPQVTDAPLLVYSPMVFMTTSDLAPGLRQQADLYQSLVNAQNHQDLDPNSTSLPINFVHTAPTRSNSGLQTLVAQFASVSDKRPENLTADDVETYQQQVQQIQKKVARYGVSTGTLARDMVKNGPYWASIGSVYESLVIEANSNPQNSQTRYEAVYPKTTFTSNMRAILPDSPWVSGAEKAAATEIIEYLRSPAVQKLAIDQGLRPGTPGIELGPKFSPQFGVETNPQYDSLRPPQPEVVAKMLQSWQQFAKKPSLVVMVVDSSGSMSGNKLPSVQSTLSYYVENLGPQEKIALIDFDSQIGTPIVVEGTPEGKARGRQFINNLKADGGTLLYDSALYAHDWLRQNYREEAINAVIILTDGKDSGSQVSLEALSEKLKQSGFNSDRRMAFFTIGYGQGGQSNSQVLEQIAELNGGYYRQGDPATISQLMSDLQMEF